MRGWWKSRTQSSTKVQQVILADLWNGATLTSSVQVHMASSLCDLTSTTSQFSLCSPICSSRVVDSSLATPKLKLDSSRQFILSPTCAHSACKSRPPGAHWYNLINQPQNTMTLCTEVINITYKIMGVGGGGWLRERELEKFDPQG